MADKPKPVVKRKLKSSSAKTVTSKRKVVKKGSKPVQKLKQKPFKTIKKTVEAEQPKAPRVIPATYEPGELTVNLYSTKGKVVKSIKLPKVFDYNYRPDLIRKDVKASRANRRQRYGPGAKAGMRHAVSQWGKGRGTSRVQRLTQGNAAAESPPNVGGRRAHPPRPEHDFSLKINRKERQYARYSALASTALPEIVRQRGHRFGKNVTVPVVIEDDFAEIERTRKVIKVLELLKIYDDVERATDGKHVRVGRGKMRGRRYKSPKSIIIVVPEMIGVAHGAKNLPGVEIVTPENLNTEILAPGGDPGRLAIFTESSLKILGGWKNV